MTGLAEAVRTGRTQFPNMVVKPFDSPRLLVSGVNNKKIGSKVTRSVWKGMPITQTISRSGCWITSGRGPNGTALHRHLLGRRRGGCPDRLPAARAAHPPRQRMNYYNDVEPYCAAWLRNLIAEGLIPAGDVDERSIADVQPGDLAGYTQCHFFAGIGGWSLALRLAGWPDDRSVWTGSCPCQPFSSAGALRGFADKRHLWPEFRRLIAERLPAVVFGEQVANAAEWLATVRGDLEALGYAMGAAPIEAASAGANHRRDRYWFVADAQGERWQPRSGTGETLGAGQSRPLEFEGCAPLPAGGGSAHVADADRQRQPWRPEQDGDPIEPGEQASRRGDALRCGPRGGADWWATEPGMGRVAHGVPARVAKLRAIGNAIVPQVGAGFVRAYLDTIERQRG